LFDLFNTAGSPTRIEFDVTGKRSSFLDFAACPVAVTTSLTKDGVLVLNKVIIVPTTYYQLGY
jgi:hypothetical protein